MQQYRGGDPTWSSLQDTFDELNKDGNNSCGSTSVTYYVNKTTDTWLQENMYMYILLCLETPVHLH